MRKLVLMIVTIILVSQVQAKTYLISSERELKELSSGLLPGDEVQIKDGTYTNWSVEVSSNGSQQNPIIIKAQHSGGVVFSGTVDKPIFLFSGSFIQLSGIRFEDCQLDKRDGKTGVLVEFSNSKHNKLTDCSFSRNQVRIQFTPLIIISGNGHYNEVSNCVFDGNIDNQDVQVKITKESCPQFTLITKNKFSNKTKVSWKNGNGGECVQVGQDPVLLGNITAYTTVSENKFLNCNGENEVISNKSSKNNYVSNLFESCDGELVMRGGHDCLISKNEFNGGTGGIRINGTGHQIIGNKISNIKTAIRLMYGMVKGKTDIGFYVAASNCLISKNLISNANTGILIGDSKDADWTGKFDTKRYPSPVMQSVAPFNNKVSRNKFIKVNTEKIEL